MTVAIIPEENYREKNEYYDVVISTGIGYARDYINANTSDIIIAIGGSIGTLVELGYGYFAKKKIIVLAYTGGIASNVDIEKMDIRNINRIHYAKNREEFISILSLVKKEIQDEKNYGCCATL